MNLVALIYVPLGWYTSAKDNEVIFSRKMTLGLFQVESGREGQQEEKDNSRIHMYFAGNMISIWFTAGTWSPPN